MSLWTVYFFIKSQEKYVVANEKRIVFKSELTVNLNYKLWEKKVDKDETSTFSSGLPQEE